jgi:hypothetical protein
MSHPRIVSSGKEVEGETNVTTLLVSLHRASKLVMGIASSREIFESEGICRQNGSSEEWGEDANRSLSNCEIRGNRCAHSIDQRHLEARRGD